MPDKPITQLLREYNKTYVPGERRSTEYNKMIRHKNMQKTNIHLLHDLNRELPETLQLNKCDLKLAETLVATFNNNLKYLHKQTKKEVILLSFIFYIKKMENPKLQIEDYTILLKYGLTTSIYSLIITRVARHYMTTKPIPITTTTDYDHDLLIRKGGV